MRHIPITIVTCELRQVALGTQNIKQADWLSKTIKKHVNLLIIVRKVEVTEDSGPLNELVTWSSDRISAKW